MAAPVVHISYGVCEGPGVARRFRAHLESQGITFTKDPEAADVLIGHSGGCLMIPETKQPKRVVLIGLPWWPGKPIHRALREKLIDEYRQLPTGYFWRKLSWNALYFWRVDRTIRMWRALKQGSLWQVSGDITVVRNERDTYFSPDLGSLQFSQPIRVITMPGIHDDCWHNPEAYLSVVQS